MRDLNKKESTYFPNLDALRFLAFFFVFVHHVVACLNHKTTNHIIDAIKTKYLLNGDLGVNFFFVLSGFLITYLLLKEKDQNDKINIRSFYVKRILRIWPLYFLILLTGLAIGSLFITSIPQHFPLIIRTDLLNKDLYFFFLGNFDILKNKISNDIIGTLWSISVEEQFYLVWPLVIAIIPRQHLVKTFIVLIIFSVYYKIYGTSGVTLNLMQQYHTFSCLSDLAMGALFAQLITRSKIKEAFVNMKKYWIVFIYIIGITLIFLRVDIYNLEISQREYLKLLNYRGGGIMPRPYQYIHAIMPVIYSLFFAFIIMEQIFSNHSFFKFGKISFFTKWGKISYGLYCFHLVSMFIVVYSFMKMGYNVVQPDKTLVIVEAIIAFALTILISTWSYSYFEKRFLLLKEKISVRANQLNKKRKK